ncbi:MAG: C4-dicarboxylate ABC transporter substrate-binding protein [Betaproteobacteria bacterium]|nr:C4-dicarboxylate ABC transporter substrate-binding protein [Betaproteobacteria bacterium]
MKTSRILAAALSASLAMVCSAPVLAQDKLTATHVFPASWVYSKSFLEFVKKANTAGKGVFEIQVRGGPEAIGMFEQPAAVRDGAVDMVYTPCAFYAGTVPECDAVSASTIDGPTARKSGALAALNEAHLRRMGVIYLGWIDSGIRFHLWFKNQPKLDAKGNLDITGVKLRGNPIYNAFFTNYLKAQVINLPSTDVYTALERGTADATGWTEIGLMDANWDKFLKFRLDPPFFSTDLGVIVNARKWNSLSQKSRDLLTATVIEHETSSIRDLAVLRTKEFAELEKRGLKSVSLGKEAAAAFAGEARKASFVRMKERLEKAGGSQDADKFSKLFAPGS